MIQDQQVCSCLEEKLQIYTELSSLNGWTGAAQVEARLQVQPQSEELPQAAGLLAEALQAGDAFHTDYMILLPLSETFYVLEFFLMPIESHT